MRVLHIMASRGNGGAETYFADLTASLQELGVDQAIIMPRSHVRFADFHKSGARLYPEALHWPLRFIRRRAIARIVAQEKPDLIHAWMRRGASLVPQVSIPVIGWFGGYYHVPHFARCTHFVGVTRDIVAHMRTHGVAEAKSFFIPTFPVIEDQPAIDRATLATPAQARVLLSLSRLHPKKGLDVFLRALAGLPDCIAWLAGDGPLDNELKALAQELGIAERVRFLGWRTDRAALLRAADICVLPSRYEPFGTVILEAWAARTPLVACASAGPAAHVTHEQNGMVVPIDDVEGLRASLRRVLDEAPLRQRLIEEGYATWQRDYTRPAVTAKMQDLYQKIIANAGSPAA